MGSKNNRKMVAIVVALFSLSLFGAGIVSAQGGSINLEKDCQRQEISGQVRYLCPGGLVIVDGDVQPADNDEGNNLGDVGESFNPVPDYEQSCEPERTQGCTWDVGARGAAWYEPLRRVVNVVGIVKGVRIEWDGNVARQFTANDGEDRCSLVVIPTDNWLENLRVLDANVTTYFVWGGDVEGWTKTLAVQAAYEQHANYGCPQRSWPQDFDIWGSNISSPPVGYDDPDNSATSSSSTDTTSMVSEPADDGTAATSGNAQPEPANNSQPTCKHDTVNCKARKATGDHGGSLNFGADAAVYGWEITIGGRTYNDCYFADVPRSGKVVDGVVNPWKNEVKNARRCR